MERIFKTKLFHRWQQQIDLSDDSLQNAVLEMKKGLVDAHLGGLLFKKRIALPNRSKSRSTRAIIATNLGNRWLFLYGFSKSDQENINKRELESFKEFAIQFFSYSEEVIELALLKKELYEVKNEI